MWITKIKKIKKIGTFIFAQVTLTQMVKQKWDSGEITSVGSCTPPDQPHREDGLNVVAPGKIKRGKGGTLVSKIVGRSNKGSVEVSKNQAVVHIHISHTGKMV